jgi:hypothetical protein
VLLPCGIEPTGHASLHACQNLEGAISNGKLGSDREPTAPQVEQELFPRLGGSFALVTERCPTAFNINLLTQLLQQGAQSPHR